MIFTTLGAAFLYIFVPELLVTIGSSARFKALLALGKLKDFIVKMGSSESLFILSKLCIFKIESFHELNPNFSRISLSCHSSNLGRLFITFSIIFL